MDPKYKRFCYKTFFETESHSEVAENLEIVNADKLSKYTIRTIGN